MYIGEKNERIRMLIILCHLPKENRFILFVLAMEDVPRDSRSELCGDTLIKTHREIVYVNLSSEIKLLISEFSCFCYI